MEIQRIKSGLINWYVGMDGCILCMYVCMAALIFLPFFCVCRHHQHLPIHPSLPLSYFPVVSIDPSISLHTYTGRSTQASWCLFLHLPSLSNSLNRPYPSISLCIPTQAVAAKHHGVSFYIAAPFTSFDLTLASGKQIVIEERPAKELTHVQGQQVGRWMDR